MEEKILQQHITEIRKYLKTDVRYDLSLIPRPFIIELAGSPSSGKSELIDGIDSLLRRNGLKHVERPQEGATAIRHISRTTPLYNLRTALEALPKLIDVAAGHAHDVVLFERGAFDAYVWMCDWHKNGKLSDEELSAARTVLLSRFWIDTIDIAYFVVCDPEETIRRYLHKSSSQKTGGTTNLKKVTELREVYMEGYRQLSPEFPQLQLIDTTHMSIPEMIDMVFEKTIIALAKKTNPSSP